MSVADDADRTGTDAGESVSGKSISMLEIARTHAGVGGTQQQPDKSLALLAWTLCLNRVWQRAYSKPAQISRNVSIIR
nr:hypothetical protein [Escherichia coli O25b:H4-ST131]